MFNSNATLPVSIPLNMGNGFGGGFGNDFDSIIALAIIAMIFGWNGNGGGIFGGGYGGAGVQDGYILASDFATIERKLDDVNNGLCSLGYDQLGQMNGINTNIANLGYNVQAGFNSVMVNDANNARDILAAVNDCCCKNQTAFLNAQYNAATEACATRQAITDAKADILAYLNAEKMADLQAENQGLRLAASQQAQNNYLISQLRPAPTPAYVVQNPYCNCNYGNFGYYGGTTIA